MMKRMIKGIAAAVLTMSMLTGCSSRPNLVLQMEPDGKKCTAEFRKSSKDDFALSGTLVVEEGEGVSYEAALEKGSVLLEVIPADESLTKTASPEQLEAFANTEENAFAKELKGTEGGVIETLVPGDYYVRVTAVQKADGTIKLEVLPKN